MNIFGYACVKNNKLSACRDDEVKKTKAYKQLKNFNVDENNIFIDILTVAHPEQALFDVLLDNLSSGDVVVIPSVNTLGKCNTVALELYKKMYAKKICVLFLSELTNNNLCVSTANPAFEHLKFSEAEFDAKCELLFNHTESNKGRPGTVITGDFIRIYWLYERFLIEEQTAYKNKYFSISKGGFHSLANIYEKSSRYSKDEIEQEALYRISGIVKRRGVLSVSLVNLYDKMSKDEISNITQEELNIACDKNGTNRISLISFKRCYIKFKSGRSASAKATINNKDTVLNNELKIID